MKKLVRDKRGIEFLQEVVMFIILNVIFFAALFFFVSRAGTGVTVKEEIKAKEIALLIDQAKQGTTLKINISRLYKEAEKNKYKGKPVDFNYKENKVVVRLAKGKGYSYRYFTKLKSGSVSLDEDNKILEVRV